MNFNWFKKVTLFIAPIFLFTSCKLDDIGLNTNNDINNVDGNLLSVNYMNGDSLIYKESVEKDSIANMALVNDTYKNRLIKKDKPNAYSFKGWNRVRQKNDIGEIEENVVITTNTTFYAVYTDKILNINWYNGDELLYSEEVKYGTILKYNGENPIKEKSDDIDYVFAGWNYNRQKDDVGEVQNEIKATTDLNVYAVYRQNKYTITLKDDETIIDSNEYKYGDNIIIPSTYEKASFVGISKGDYLCYFKGWSNKTDGQVFTSLPEVINDETYYAVYEKHLIGADYTKLDDLLSNEKWHLEEGAIMRRISVVEQKKLVFANVKVITRIGVFASTKYNAFSGTPIENTYIQEVYIGEGINFINKNAFNFMTNLSTVSLPSTLTTAGSDSFKQCSSDLIIKYNGTKEQFNNLNPTNWVTCKQVICIDGTFNMWW